MQPTYPRVQIEDIQKYKNYKYKKKIQYNNTEVIIISFSTNINQPNTEHPFLSVNVQNQKSTHTY